MATYSKPYLPVNQQLALIKSRGMVVTDDARAIHYLERLGYYRLSGYWYPMRQSSTVVAPGGGRVTTVSDNFRPNVRFEDVANLYVFDKNLRMLLLDAVERIEVAIRVSVALILGVKSPYAHVDKSLLHGNFAKRSKFPDGPTEHDKWLERYRRCVSRSHEEFIAHFKSNYPGQGLPIWIAVEVWDFGLLSHFINGMTHADQSTLAAYYNVPRTELFLGWIKALNEVRNTCAHHSRLWNKPLINNPSPPRIGEVPELDHIAGNVQRETRVYVAAAALQYLLKRVNPTSSWSNRVKALFQAFPAAPGIAVSQSGFPPNWEQLPLWN